MALLLYDDFAVTDDFDYCTFVIDSGILYSFVNGLRRHCLSTFLLLIKLFTCCYLGITVVINYLFVLLSQAL